MIRELCRAVERVGCPAFELRVWTAPKIDGPGRGSSGVVGRLLSVRRAAFQARLPEIAGAFGQPHDGVVLGFRRAFISVRRRWADIRARSFAGQLTLERISDACTPPTALVSNHSSV